MTCRHSLRHLTREDLFNDLQKQTSTEQSSQDQLLATAIHLWVGTRQHGPTLTKTELEEVIDELDLQFEHSVDTVVGNLVDHGVLDGFQDESQAEWMTIRERDGEFVMGEDLEPAVEEELERAIQHIQLKDPPQSADPATVADGGVVTVNSRGETLREAIREEFDDPSTTLEDYLRDPGTYTQRDRLNTVVDVIESSTAFKKPDTFDKIELIHRPNHYHLSDSVRDRYDLA